MTKEVVTLAPETHLHDAIRTLLEAGVKRLPVVDAGRKVLGIVTRRDLLQPFLRADEDIHREVSDDVIHRTLWLDPAALEVEVKRGIVTLRGEVDRRSEKEFLAALAWRIDGVVGVKDELSYRTDDRELRPETPRSDLGWGENWRRPRS
jgi:CBS domain-containing protein